MADIATEDNKAGMGTSEHGIGTEVPMSYTFVAQPFVMMSNTLRKPLGLAQGSRQAEISNISDIIVHESHPVPNVGNALPSSRLRVPHSVIAR